MALIKKPTDKSVTPISKKFTKLVALVQAGDDNAMAQLIEQFNAPFCRAARQLIGKTLRAHLDSVDLVQSVQVILWLGLRTGRFSVASPEHLLSLAKTLLRRKVSRYCRSVKLQLPGSKEVSLVDTVVDHAFYPASQEPNPHQSSEFDDLVEHFLDQLGDLDRQLVKLRLQGYSTADAARQLDLDSGYLRVRLGRLRKRFAQFRESIVKTSSQDPLREPNLPDMDRAAD